MIVWAFFLRKEAVYYGFDSNDTKSHQIYIELLLKALNSGSLGLDTWDSHCCYGNAMVRTYQNYGHMGVALVMWMFGLTNATVAVHFAICVGFVLQIPAFYWAVRLMGMGRPVAIAAAWLGPLLSSGEPLGHELRSYLFGGFGIFSQALVVPCYLIATAYVARLAGWVRNTQETPFFSGLAAGTWLSLTFLIQHFYGYMVLLNLGVLLSLGLFLGLRDLKRASISTATMAAVFIIVCSYQLLSIVQDSALMHQTAWYHVDRWSGMGIEELWGILWRGQPFDNQRWRVFSAMIVVGIFACIRRDRWFLLFPLLTGIVFCAGKKTFPTLLGLAPGVSNIHLERFIGMIHLSVILIAAVGLGDLAEMLFTVFRRYRRWLPRTAAALGMVSLVAAMGYLIHDRYKFIAKNDQTIARQLERQGTWDSKLVSSLTDQLELGHFWSYRLDDGTKPQVGRVAFYNVVTSLGYSQVSSAEQSQTFASDLMYLFQPYKEAHYRVFNITAMVLPTARVVIPTFLKEIYQASDIGSYAAPGRGDWDVVGTPRIEFIETGKQFTDVAHEWLSGTEHEKNLYPTIVPNSVAKKWPAAIPSTSPAHDEVEWGEVRAFTRLKNGKATATLFTETPGALGILRTSFHPRWEVTLNGAKVQPLWVGPGFLGVQLPKGESHIEVNFPTDPLRSLLFVVGGVTLIFGFAITAVQGLRSRRKETVFAPGVLAPQPA